MGNKKGSSSVFRPRRRPAKSYRPFESKRKVGDKDPFPFTPAKEVIVPGELKTTNQNELEQVYGPVWAEYVRSMQLNREIAELDPEGIHHDDLEEGLRMADYLTAERGSTEEQIFERRMLEHYTHEEREQFQKDLDHKLYQAEKLYLDFENDEIRDLKPPKPKKSELTQEHFDGTEEDLLYSLDDDDPDNRFYPNQWAFGDWSEYLVDVRRGVHNWRGGRIETFRALIVGGNGQGCAGFGVGKGPDAMKAMDVAGRKCRQNVFFVDRYLGERLTRDLVGVHNSCKVVIRTQSEQPGLRGNFLIREILKRFGIVHASCKAYGRRHTWSVVYATFKALQTHESMEDIAMRKGRRFVAVDRALRTRTA